MTGKAKKRKHQRRLPFKTVAEFHAWAAPRCEPRVDRCECLVWKGATNNGTSPRSRVEGSAMWSVRHIAWRLVAKDAYLEPRDSVKQDVDCHPLCIEPKHQIRQTPSERNKGRPKSIAARQNMALAAIRSRYPLTQEELDLILNDPRSGEKIAQELGCERKRVWRIRSGKSIHVLVNNPFAQLLR